MVELIGKPASTNHLQSVLHTLEMINLSLFASKLNTKLCSSYEFEVFTFVGIVSTQYSIYLVVY
jgi:hypothetical protein